jgi:tRNA-dihydrouridine synthase
MALLFQIFKTNGAFALIQMYEDSGFSASRKLAIGLAPMEGVSDYAFRMWLATFAPLDFMVTPFLRATAGLEFRHVSQLFCPEVLLPECAVPYNVIPQFMGSDAEDVCRVAEPFLKHCEFVDLNCGCPASTVFKHGAGSALLQNPERFYAFLMRCQELLGERRFSVKLRLGIQSDGEFDSLLDVLGRVRPRLVTVHARTQKEGYTGVARWNLIERAAQELSCEVWGSGDVVSGVTLGERLKMAPSVRGVMIGRGAIANPWVFEAVSGRGPLVPWKAVFWALSVFALFQEAQFRGPRELFSLVLFVRPWEASLGHDEQLWRDFYLKCVTQVFAKNIDSRNLVCDERVLSRLKQIVKLLRVHDNSFAQTGLLRVSRTSEFFELLERLILEKTLPLG